MPIKRLPFTLYTCKKKIKEYPNKQVLAEI